MLDRNSYGWKQHPESHLKPKSSFFVIKLGNIYIRNITPEKKQNSDGFNTAFQNVHGLPAAVFPDRRREVEPACKDLQEL